jgi:hypothetical protein
MKSLVIDVEKLALASDACAVSEGELLMVINTCLDQMSCCCTVTALRHVDSSYRNWEVASVELQLAEGEDANERLGHVGQLIAMMTDGYQVAWPSTLLH